VLETTYNKLRKAIVLSQIHQIGLRIFMKLGLLMIILITGWSCNPIQTKVEDPKPYNVLFIALDDLNDWTGFLKGHPQAQTPHMDRLAQQGVAFTKANRRHELAKKYGKQYVDAGFTLNIKKKRLQSGNYQLGIIIAKKGKIVGFKFTKQHKEI